LLPFAGPGIGNHNRAACRWLSIVPEHGRQINVAKDNICLATCNGGLLGFCCFMKKFVKALGETLGYLCLIAIVIFFGF
jgi:hypothetical protein